MALRRSPLLAIAFKSSNAFSHCAPFSHAEIAAPYVTSESRTPASCISANSSSPRSHARPFSHAEIAALYTT